MSTTAPPPPTKRLERGAILSAGITIGILALTSVGHFVFSNIPAPRLTAYVTVGFIGMCVSGWLSTTYMVQKHRRDAWWDGFAAGDEPLADVIPLRDLKGGKDVIELRNLNGYEGNGNNFIVSSPS